ncbi:MAG: ubiquinol-cytochrome C chaperone family protein [Magnetococcales bacterium]|nr:ubiquinol-cytochrome C chaperone family protein [Magnetococcales bacterium]
MTFLLSRLFAGRHQNNELRQRVMAMHGRIVDEVLEWTREDRLGLKDDFSLRFEVMILAVAVVLVALKDEQDLLQGLWDMTFEGFEESLRQRGVNDIRIGARMRVIIHNAMGRCRAYMGAMKAADEGALRQSIVRNVFNGVESQQETVEILLSSVLQLPQRVLDDNYA